MKPKSVAVRSGSILVLAAKKDWLVSEGKVYTKDRQLQVGTLCEEIGDKMVVRMLATPLPEESDTYQWARDWDSDLSEREVGLLKNCEQYAANDPSGIPGHALMLLVAKLAQMLDESEREGWY